MKQKNFFEGMAPLLARLLFAGVFLSSAAGLTRAFPNVVRVMMTKGVPAPDAILGLTIAAWLIGGLCLLVGFRVRPVATVLALLMIPVTFGMHAPWMADAASFQIELNNFLKNLGFIAGLLALAAGPVGLLAIDGNGFRGRSGTDDALPGLR